MPRNDWRQDGLRGMFSSVRRGFRIRSGRHASIGMRSVGHLRRPHRGMRSRTIELQNDRRGVFPDHRLNVRHCGRILSAAASIGQAALSSLQDISAELFARLPGDEKDLTDHFLLVALGFDFG